MTKTHDFLNHCGITEGDFFLREFQRETLHMVSQLVTEYLEDNYSIIEVDEDVLDMVNFVQALEKYTMATRGEQ